MDRHEHAYRQREVTEKEDRAAQYATLEAQFSTLLRRVEDSARTASARYSRELRGLEKAVEEEAAVRKFADAGFAGDMAATLARIRALALEVYGIEEEGEGALIR